MKRMVGTGLILGIGLALSACGSSAPATVPGTEATAAVPTTPPATSVSEIPAVSSAAAATCATDLQSVNTALEAYSAMNQKYPATLDVLFSSGLLKQKPTFGGHSVSYDAQTGTVTADC